jgi:flagellum-specific ATP synthase
MAVSRHRELEMLDSNALLKLADTVEVQPRNKVYGRLTRVVGLTIEAIGLRAGIGSRCLIEHPEHAPVEAEVVGFDNETCFLVTLAGDAHLRPGSTVQVIDHNAGIGVGDALLGRVIDARGEPLDQRGELRAEQNVSLQTPRINPLLRKPIEEPLDVGVKAINSLLTIGRGQRIGLFAGSGVGKSVLLGMITRFTQADVVVVGLIGERGREEREFIDHSLGEEGMAKSVVVASPADDTPLMRVRAANLTTRIAEYYRDQGKNVLLLMDSLSRFAEAHREIALAAGEPPASRGFPASVFAHIPNLVERAGNASNGDGSLTAIYTVLTDGDAMANPVADCVRAILDGHIVLSRELADAGHYPAIDVEASISRVMPSVVSDEALADALEFKRLLARYGQVKDLLAVGAYQPGSDPVTDRAVALQPQLMRFLQQSMREGCDQLQSAAQMQQAMQLPMNGNEHAA